MCYALMKMLLLDTHSLVWLRSSPEKLRRQQLLEATRVLADGGWLLVSAMTLWELAKLAQKGRLAFLPPIDRWIEDLTPEHEFEIVHLTPQIVARSVLLEGFHRDPADELIVATALELGSTLVTADRKIRAWGGVPVL